MRTLTRKTRFASVLLQAFLVLGCENTVVGPRTEAVPPPAGPSVRGRAPDGNCLTYQGEEMPGLSPGQSVGSCYYDAPERGSYSHPEGTK